MNTAEKQQHEAFKAAKQIALTIGKNQFKRASVNDAPVNYCGCNMNGRMFVLGDTEQDIQNPDTTIMGKPAREVFGDFTIMAK